jgi:hypothetical protein
MPGKLKRPSLKKKPRVNPSPGTRKLSDLPRADGEKMCSFFGQLLTDLKNEWESRLENRGKKIKYSELWSEYVAATKTRGRSSHRGGKAKPDM